MAAVNRTHNENARSIKLIDGLKLTTQLAVFTSFFAFRRWSLAFQWQTPLLGIARSRRKNDRHKNFKMLVLVSTAKPGKVRLRTLAAFCTGFHRVMHCLGSLGREGCQFGKDETERQTERQKLC